ncbi:MAG: type I-E CRISPR-associated protein Cas5/CasD [Propionibacteriaceae bacterium]|jgi:CRISPR system Cascade subunit CasD|nr:type I-E CRISPR-associated protein Cas5/CasD [Propionibacteriaceae bacterium]
MSTLLLKLAGPLQSWGAQSRFPRRDTRHEPTKSAVIGLIAAAQGRRRSDPIEDLLDLRFAVRIDQPGVLLRDFHTAHNLKGESMPLSERFYLSDAVFIAAIEADRVVLDGIAGSLLSPAFPLFLGRRSCVPSGKLVLGVVDDDLVTALRQHPWEAATWFQRHKNNRDAAEIQLELIRDGLVGDPPHLARETVRDRPLSFSPELRQYGWRDVVHDEHVVVHNPAFVSDQTTAPVVGLHDPMALL